MLIGKDFLFLHLQKTGGNHVGKLLARYVEFDKRGKHNGIAQGLVRPHVFIGIRNPWDWYVSLWAYGCQNEGTLWSYLTSSSAACLGKLARLHGAHPQDWALVIRHAARLPRKNAGFWRRVYGNSRDPEGFRTWLRAIFDPPTCGQTGEDYSVAPLRQSCGLMTARYLQIVTETSIWRANRSTLRTQADVAAFHRRHAKATHYIRTESLEQDVAAALSLLGHPVDAGALRTGRTNASSHHPAAYYYDEELAALVAERERLICDIHGYRFPAPTAEA